jgi:glycerate 2-kinase
MNYKSVAEDIFLSGVRRVLPDNLIKKVISLNDDHLFIGDMSFRLGDINKIYVTGAGKASALMAAEVERILGERISGGHIIVKYGHSCQLNRITVTEAGHPVPDENGFLATRSVLKICRNSEENDLVICLISGGGSALLTDCPDGISPGDIMVMNNLLVKSGADIGEINAVRKHLSGVKGGHLASAAFPATLVSLILSDVTGDPLDVIASGPTVPDPSTYGEALEVIARYGLTTLIAPSIIEYLRDGSLGKYPETPKVNDSVFEKTHNILIGNNRLALESAGQRAIESGLNTFIVNDRITGDVLRVAGYITETAVEYRKNKQIKKPVCLLFGGEPTIRVSGSGLGGRNQHLALVCASLLKDIQGITILSAGTDGSDGPTSAAGAVVDHNTWTESVKAGIDPEQYIRNFDSFSFFDRRGGHIITGPTMTNVMDIIVVIVT